MSDKPLPTLSPSQQEAVAHPFADALVTAGAGSGKTRVLSERFVHLVKARCVALRRLASLTFTEKAAGQMRERIADLFRRGGDEQAQADVEFAPISTIHAFCALLLRQHAIEAGVDPAFRVLDGVESELLLSDAATLAENAISAEHPGLFEAYAMVRGESRAELIRLLRDVRASGCAIADLAWHFGDGSDLAAIAAVTEALEDYRPIGEHLPEERRPQHDEAVRRIEAALAALRAGEDDTAPFLVIAAQSGVAAMSGPRKHAYTKPRKAMGNALDALVGILLDAWGARVLLPALKEILALYAQAYGELKREEAALDFTDLELGARDVLQRAEDAARPLDLAPQGLLVDEFQDTNPLQAEILALLRAQAPQFSVGDPKQSIYRFRRADVRVIMEEQGRVGAAACHAMNASYRACAELVAGINVVNAHLFTDGAAGVPYEPLIAAASYLPSPVPPVELAIVDAGSGSNKEGARTLEAAWIAERIEALTDGTTMRLRAGPDGASVGPLRYGDIAILVRARKPLEAYEEALEARGIPYLTQSSVGFFQAPEIRDLLDVLRVVHNPGDRHALACVASGPALGAGSGELLRWFGAGPEAAWERMVAEASAGGRHAHALRTLQRIREEAVSGSLARVVEMALHDLGLLEAALLQSGGDRKAANLRKAVEFARRLDESGRRGLGDLLRHLETLRSREMKEAEAAVGGDAANVVRLTTVHSAKGLEYPVVFVADIGYGPQGNTPALFFDGRGSLAARVSDPLEGVIGTPAGYAALKAQDDLEAGQESLRLLYVAMTRAEERLILCGGCPGTKKDGEPKSLDGWGRSLWDLMPRSFEAGRDVLSMAHPDVPEVATIDLSIIPAEDIEVLRAADRVPVRVVPDAETRETAARLLAAAEEEVASLGYTRYVVSVSELLLFAESPPRYYEERVIGVGAQAAAASRWDQPLLVPGEAGESDDPDRGRRAERRALWDEPADTEAVPEGARLDRAAVGRAVHAVIEGLQAGDESVPAERVQAAVAEEGGGAEMEGAVSEMVERFLTSETGAQLRRALRAGDDVRREVDFHARIRFPGGEEVAGLDSLLVKGSIDLWLPTPSGVRLVDHKTNRAGARYRSPEALAAHYTWQLRLYTLAAERLLGEDIAGASLLLLDPGWGPEALDVPIDISGPQLEETRALCRAFARAELEGRYPEDWRRLLA
jgi:ATP-dependent helicase/nuclease subunit A